MQAGHIYLFNFIFSAKIIRIDNAFIVRDMAEIDEEKQQYIAILKQNQNDRYARFYYDSLLKTYRWVTD